MAQGPMTKGSAAVPLPLVTQPLVEKPALEVMVMAACCPVPASAGTAGTANSTASVKGDNTRSSRRMGAPLAPSGTAPQHPAPCSPDVAGAGAREADNRRFPLGGRRPVPGCRNGAIRAGAGRDRGETITIRTHPAHKQGRTAIAFWTCRSQAGQNVASSSTCGHSHRAVLIQSAQPFRLRRARTSAGYRPCRGMAAVPTVSRAGHPPSGRRGAGCGFGRGARQRGRYRGSGLRRCVSHGLLPGQADQRKETQT
jgi:hypothetical protein